jgi:hypothetical protein
MLSGTIVALFMIYVIGYGIGSIMFFIMDRLERYLSIKPFKEKEAD